MKEPPRGSVVMTDGDTGTAWQRHHKDGLWHSTAGGTETWQYLVKREPAVVFKAPGRAHDDHEIRYVEENITRSHRAIITAEGDVKLLTDVEPETDFMTNTQTHVWCVDCQQMLIPDESGLADDWQVL